MKREEEIVQASVRFNREEKDLCKTCKHYWVDFPLPLDHYEPHCEIVDSNIGYNKMENSVPYPCLKCPFDCYIKKKGE